MSQGIFANVNWGDRIQWMALLVVASFVAVLTLPSQSAASYPSYILALLMLWNVSKWKDIFAVELMRWVLLLLLWLAVSVAWSEKVSLGEVASFWGRVALVVFFLVAVAECQFRDQLQRWMVTAMTLVGAVAVLFALVNFLVTNPQDGRLNGMGQLDTHVIAALIYGVTLLFVLRYILQNKQQSHRVLGGIVAIVVIVCIGLSDSRNAWVSVTFGVMTFLLAHKVQDVRQFMAALVAGGLLLSILLLLGISSETLRDWILPRGDSFRIELWQLALDRIGEQPLLGLGILTSDDFMVQGYRLQHPHSMYLSMLHQGGVVALVLYLTVLYKAIRILLSRYDSGDAKLALSILAIALSAYLLDGHELVDKVGSSWILIWLPVAMAIGLSWSKPRDKVSD